MSRSSFWGGVAAGAAATAAGIWMCGLRNLLSRTIRVERSVQIGRPAPEVFSACARVERIPQLIRSVVSVVACDDISAWVGQFKGRRFQWDVEILQVVPNQVIGWKSHWGPRHSGRISFFPVAEDTLVHIEMNYVPEISLASFPQLIGGIDSVNIGDAIEWSLRELKGMLESTHPRWSAVPPVAMHETSREQATGTLGARPVLPNPGRNESEGG